MALCLVMMETFKPDLVYIADDNALGAAIEWLRGHPDTSIQFYFGGINGDPTAMFPDVMPQLSGPREYPITGPSL
jgi:hypothetical protein